MKCTLSCNARQKKRIIETFSYINKQQDTEINTKQDTEINTDVWVYYMYSGKLY